MANAAVKIGKLTFYNILLAIFACSGGFAYGFAYQALTASIGQPQFYIYLGLERGTTYTANILGAINGLFFAGGAFGSVSQSWVGDKLGRRKALIIASSLALIGSSLVAGTVHVVMLIVFRLVQGWGTGMIVTLAPIYLAEISPPQHRGLLLGSFATSLGIGMNVVGWISLGTYYAQNPSVQWRLPLALACIGPLVMFVGSFFIPESPRWLLWQGKSDQAWSILKKLHEGPTHSDQVEQTANAEFIQIQRQIDYDKTMGVTYWQIVKQPSYRKRALIVIVAMFAYQSTGAFGIGNYKILIYENLGFRGSMPLLLNALYTFIGTCGVMFASIYVDKTGRKILFQLTYMAPDTVVGLPAMAAALLAEALLSRRYVATDDKAGNAACIVFLFLFVFTLDMTLGPSIFIYVSELWPTPLRAKGLAIAWFTYFLGAITYTSSSALAFEKIGWRMYMVWFTCNIVNFFIVWFYFPETTNKTLEEISELFGDKVVVRITADGKNLEGDEIIEIKTTGEKDGGDDHVQVEVIENTKGRD
ncbi:hypothetical protein AYO21_10150 [Fonsecaea monophora]|uniref:Major facilitator superfamily (MFS) profile domain-containing protein n=1 Tax=Fonsecaea monophora TaxID=254056 RepID=A0A177EXJ7_9EURO|nr:hypothetical protein AYO21_10150 [Fonsecaea monophora]OAG35679.1 hypothetical protein AYO21_10150 [Fonsecaea monophora]